MTDLRCCSAEDLIASLAPGSVDAVIADPPWIYASSAGGLGRSHTARGRASAVYQGLECPEIAAQLDAAASACANDCYLAVWTTWPKISEWCRTDLAQWNHLTGAVWGKVGGAPGMGYHFRGDSEPLLMYRRGRPLPLEGSKTNLWLHPRLGHSEKPPNALDALVLMACPVGGLILDPFAGESASLARCCARLGRRYVGAEIDPERHQRALRRLAGESAAQSRMVGQESMFGGAS